jgi:hypothetical protein
MLPKRIFWKVEPTFPSAFSKNNIAHLHTCSVMHPNEDFGSPNERLGPCGKQHLRELPTPDWAMT